MSVGRVMVFVMLQLSFVSLVKDAKEGLEEVGREGLLLDGNGMDGWHDLL